MPLTGELSSLSVCNKEKGNKRGLISKRIILVAGCGGGFPRDFFRDANGNINISDRAWRIPGTRQAEADPRNRLTHKGQMLVGLESDDVEKHGG